MDTLTIVLVIILTALGITAGYLIAVLRQHPQPPKQTPDTAAEPAPDGAVEVARIWRTGDNQLRVGMDGQQLDDAKTISPEQRRRLVKMVVDMRPWLETSSGAVTPSISPVIDMPARAGAIPQVPPVIAPIEEKPAPVVLKSIVEQIDDVLQDTLKGSPLENLDIQLTEGPGGAVVVRIGLRKYDGIDNVPDPKIKELIRQAIARWEKGTDSAR